jgi:hypothetical protein
MKKHIKLLQHKKALDAAHSALAPMMLLAVGAPAADADGNSDDNFGIMDIPKPMAVNSKGDMDEETFKATSFTHTVCQNMVQSSLIKEANKLGYDTKEALSNMDLWVDAYVNFPFPFYNFVDTQNGSYEEKNFSLKANAKVVESIVNIKGVADLKSAVVGALKNSGGELVKFSKKKRDFNYFGIITGYKKTGIQVRLVKFQMHMENTDVKTLCGGTQKTSLNSNYTTYQFSADTYMMKKMQESVQNKLVDEFADTLFEFAHNFYKDALKDWNTGIAANMRKILNK